MIGASFLLAVALSAAPAASEPAPPPGRLVRVVGEQLSFEKIDCLVYRWGGDDPETEEAGSRREKCTGDDLHYRARYRVLVTIDGQADDSVEFLATRWTDHYAESRHALLYVLQSADGTLLPSGLAVSVYPTADGDWASCDADEGSEQLEFAGDLVFGRTNGMSPHGIARRFPSTDFAVIGQEAVCIRGRRLPALVEALDADMERLREDGFPFLPPPTQPKASP